VQITQIEHSYNPTADFRMGVRKGGAKRAFATTWKWRLRTKIF